MVCHETLQGHGKGYDLWLWELESLKFLHFQSVSSLFKTDLANDYWY